MTKRMKYCCEIEGEATRDESVGQDSLQLQSKGATDHHDVAGAEAHGNEFQRSLSVWKKWLAEDESVAGGEAIEEEVESVQPIQRNQEEETTPLHVDLRDRPKPHKTQQGSPPTKADIKYRSIRNYGEKRYKHACQTPVQDLPYFKPCRHKGDCTLETCSCVKNKLFCTLECCNGKHSANFFRGCNCQGYCHTNHCMCHAANRECDAEICNCRLCKDGACKNSNIVIGASPPLRVGISTIPGAGRGCFAVNDIQKGDFIGEYTGEILSETEAMRRQSQSQDHYYLFTISSDCVVDGRSLGNATRFINHSSKKHANAKPRRKCVNHSKKQCYSSSANSLVCSRISKDWSVRQ